MSAAPAPDLGGAAERLRWARDVRTALEQIPAADRQLLILLYAARLSYQAAAAQLGVTGASMGARHRAALRSFGAALDLE